MAITDFNWMHRHAAKKVRKQLQAINDYLVGGGGGGGGGIPEMPLAIEHGGTGSKTLAAAKTALEIPDKLPTGADGQLLGYGANGKVEAKDAPQAVPTPTAADASKVISVKGADEYELVDLPDAQLPVPTTADKGKIPAVQADGTYGLEDAPEELPEVTAANATQVLTANADLTVSWKDVPSELPEHDTTDKDKVFCVDANGDVALDYVTKELPAATAADKGKALMIDAAGEYGLDNIPQQLPVPTLADKDKIPIAQADGTYALKAQKEELPQSTSSDVNKALTVNAAGKPEWKLLASDATPTKKTLTTMDAASSHFSGGNVTLTMSGNVGVLRFEEVYFSASTLTFAADGRCTISFTVPLGSSGYKFADGCSINCGATKLADVKHGESYSLIGYKLGVTGAPGMTAFNCELTFYKPDYALGSTDIVRLGDEVCVVLEKEGV